MERRDKINLLKGIAAGTASLELLKPQHLLIKVGYEGGTKYCINDKPVSQEVYTNASKEQRAGSGTSFVAKVVSYGTDES